MNEASSVLSLSQKINSDFTDITDFAEIYMWKPDSLVLIPSFIIAGSGGMDRIFSPGKLSRRSSFGSISFTPKTPTSNLMMESSNEGLEATISLLEAEVADSQAKCSTLVSEMNDSNGSIGVDEVKQLNQKLESMQILLMRLRALIWCSTWESPLFGFLVDRVRIKLKFCPCSRLLFFLYIIYICCRVYTRLE